MISNSSIPPVEFVNEKNEQCDLSYATCIKVNVVNLSTIISAVRAQQYAMSPESLKTLLRENPEEIFSPQGQKNSATIFQFVATHPECINLLKDIIESLKSLDLLHLINEGQGMAKTKSTKKISIPPLYSAIAFGNLEGARSLIEAGAEVNFRVTSDQFSLL